MSDVTPDAENTQVTATPASGSAPDVQNPQGTSGGQVDNTEQQQKSGQDDTKQHNREFFQHRQVEKQNTKATSLEDKIAALTKTVDSLGSQLTKKAEAPDLEVDPATVAQPQKARTEEEIIQIVKGQLSEAQADGAYNASSDKAGNWLLTRKHIVQDPNAQTQIEHLLKNRYAKAASVDPEAAAEAAYSYWCSQKGVAPDLEGIADPSFASRAGGISPSGSTGGSVSDVNENNVDNITMTKEAAHAYTKKFKTESPEWWAATTAIDKALTEGRITGLKK